MRCTKCKTMVDISDNFCRHCGSVLTSSLLPVPVKSSMVEYSPTVSPVLWKGAALALAGKALEVGARKVLEHMVSRASVRTQVKEPLNGKKAQSMPVKPGRDAVTSPTRVVRTIVFWQQIIEK